MRAAYYTGAAPSEVRTRLALGDVRAQRPASPSLSLPAPASMAALYRWVDDDFGRRRSLLPAEFAPAPALAPNRGAPTWRVARPRGHSTDADVSSPEMSSDASARRPLLHAQHRFGGSTHELP
jgi:hypothetical protein